MGKRNHGSETLKWFYLWNTMQAGSHAAIQIKPFLVFHLKLTGLQLFKENKFIVLSLLRKGGKLRAYRPSGEWKQNENTVRREWLAAARGNQSCKWTRGCSKWMQRGGIKGDLCRLKQNSQKKNTSYQKYCAFFWNLQNMRSASIGSVDSQHFTQCSTVWQSEKRESCLEKLYSTTQKVQGNNSVPNHLRGGKMPPPKIISFWMLYFYRSLQLQ